MFHVEKNKKNLRRKLFSVKERVFSKDSFDVIFDYSSGIARTDVSGLNDLDRFVSTEDYLPHSKKSFKILHLIYAFAREIMLRFKYKKIKRYFIGAGKILDVGCGKGDFIFYLNKKGKVVFGTETSQVARQICLSKGLTVHSSIKEIREKKFQMVTLWHVLEHLEKPSEAVSDYHKILEDQGILIIAVPNLKSHDSEHYKQFWGALDVPRHLWHFTPEGLIKLIENQGFVNDCVFPLWFDALYISYLSEKNASKSIPFFRGILKGIYFNLRALKTKKYSSLVFIFKKSSQ